MILREQFSRSLFIRSPRARSSLVTQVFIVRRVHLAGARLHGFFKLGALVRRHLRQRIRRNRYADDLSSPSRPPSSLVGGRATPRIRSAETRTTQPTSNRRTFMDSPFHRRIDRRSVGSAQRVSRAGPASDPDRGTHPNRTAPTRTAETSPHTRNTARAPCSATAAAPRGALRATPQCAGCCTTICRNAASLTSSRSMIVPTSSRGERNSNAMASSSNVIKRVSRKPASSGDGRRRSAMLPNRDFARSGIVPRSRTRPTRRAIRQ